jgi:hypothetical protein
VVESFPTMSKFLFDPQHCEKKKEGRKEEMKELRKERRKEGRKEGGNK